LPILREQRRELEAEFAAGRIDAAEHAQGQAELERRFVLESAVAPEVVRSHQPRRGWAIGLALALPLLAGGLYLKLGNPAALDPANTMAPQSVTPDQIDGMVAKLAAKVKANPDDLEGLQMLGRSYMVLGRYKEAVQAFSDLALRRPDAQVYADWADALGSVEGNTLAGEPEKLINKALQLDPDHIKALALAGTVAFDRKDFKAAITHWERMASRVDPQSEMGKSAQAMLKEARDRAGLPAASTPEPAAAAKPVLTVSGHLSVASAIKAKVDAEDVVFVFARAQAGGPPLAALRFRAGDLPLDYDFAKSQAMMGAAPQGKIVIGARVSKSGNPVSSPGDLQGFSGEVSPDATGVVVEINAEVK